MINGLDLFSGIGGITEALAEWVKPIAYCENDRYAQAVLLSRMERGELPTAPIWDDVRTLRGNMLPEIDIIYGGFPCQDISIAGNGAGLGGERSGLFFEIERLVCELRPQFVFLENVPALVHRGIREVAGSLAALRYDCRWGMLSAYDLGAPHIRERFWLLAYSNQNRWDERNESKQVSKSGSSDSPVIEHDGKQESLADCDKMRKLQPKGGERKQWGRASDGSWWKAEPGVGRVANGLRFRSNRIECLGNSVVPQCVKEALARLIQQ